MASFRGTEWECVFGPFRKLLRIGSLPHVVDKV